MSFRRFCLFFGLLGLLLLDGSGAFGQLQRIQRSAADAFAADTATYPIAPASALAPVRRPSAQHLTSLRERGDLRYQSPGYRPVQNLWERFWMWFWDWIERIFSSKAGATTAKGVWYAFLLAAVVWVVLRVLKLDLTALFGRAPRAAPAYDTETAETPFTDDLPARLAEAEAVGNYRLAVRLGYLLALRQLADRDLVRWLPDKTNQHYVRELVAGPVRDHFARLTRQFEVAWYGELHPTAADYATVRETRAVLTQTLTASAPKPQPTP